MYWWNYSGLTDTHRRKVHTDDGTCLNILKVPIIQFQTISNRSTTGMHSTNSSQHNYVCINREYSWIEQIPGLTKTIKSSVYGSEKTHWKYTLRMTENIIIVVWKRQQTLGKMEWICHLWVWRVMHLYVQLPNHHCAVAWDDDFLSTL